MKMYVVVDERPEMGSKEVIRVFSREDDAERFFFILDRKNFPSAVVESHKVIGRYEYPAEVFAAYEYDSGNDTFYFTKLFANYDDAKRAVGDRGTVRTFKPDARVVR
jgi:hypothetical protein